MIELAHKNKNLEFSFSLLDIIKILEKKNQTENKEAIHKSIHRMALSRFSIFSNKKIFSGGLVDAYQEDKTEEGKHLIRIGSETLNLFSFSSVYNKKIRNNLKGNLAKFYYMFFCSHKSFVYNYKLETYHELSNSDAEFKEFKRISKKAFEEINEKTDYQAVIIQNSENRDIVVIQKNNT